MIVKLSRAKRAREKPAIVSVRFNVDEVRAGEIQLSEAQCSLWFVQRYTSRTSGIGITNFPPFALYSDCCSRISSAKFQVSSST